MLLHMHGDMSSFSLHSLASLSFRDSTLSLSLSGTWLAWRSTSATSLCTRFWLFLIIVKSLHLNNSLLPRTSLACHCHILFWSWPSSLSYDQRFKTSKTLHTLAVKWGSHACLGPFFSLHFSLCHPISRWCMRSSWHSFIFFLNHCNGNIIKI